MAKKNAYKGTENPELSKAMHGKNSSSAADPHDPRPRKLRDRTSIKRNAIDDQKNEG